MYKHLIRPILFRFNPEKAHAITFSLLRFFSKVPGFRAVLRLIFKYESPSLHRDVFGIDFPNPVGLAGGLDKNGEYYNLLSDFGFGFVEIGSLTPKAQEGNPKPRLFRDVRDSAIINHMGINNNGVLYAIEHLKADYPKVIVAANIARNTATDINDVAKDYDYCFSMLYDFVDMFVVNISCPNVEGISELQDVSNLSDFMDILLDKRMSMDTYRPVLLKVSPDLSHSQLDDILDYCLRSGVDGIVAGNTTKSREGLSISKAEIDKMGPGGLSGAPLFKKNLELVSYIHEKTKGRLPIIGVGGIMSPEDAKAMLDAGASLVEIYSGFIYEGPGLIKRILQSIDIKQDTEK
jgi:dihydroorotate dehydrogenase